MKNTHSNCFFDWMNLGLLAASLIFLKLLIPSVFIENWLGQLAAGFFLSAMFFLIAAILVSKLVSDQSYSYSKVPKSVVNLHSINTGLGVCAFFFGLLFLLMEVNSCLFIPWFLGVCVVVSTFAYVHNRLLALST